MSTKSPASTSQAQVLGAEADRQPDDTRAGEQWTDADPGLSEEQQGSGDMDGRRRRRSPASTMQSPSASCCGPVRWIVAGQLDRPLVEALQPAVDESLDQPVG